MHHGIIDHFIPSVALNIPSIYQEYAKLHQGKNEFKMLYSDRVSKLADCSSKRAGQEYTEITQIPTFVEGLCEGFTNFSKDYLLGLHLPCQD